MQSCAVFAMTEDKLYRERRNTCPVQLGHCLCVLGIVLSLVFFLFFPALTSCLLPRVDLATGTGCQAVRTRRRVGAAAPPSN